MKGKVVAITGASSGIGAALAKRFAHAGYTLSLCARNVQALDELVQKLGQQEHYVAPVDVTDEAACHQWIKATIDKFGGIDILINNAGISMRAQVGEVKAEVLRQVMEVNFWGMVYPTQAALESIKQRKGSIVGMSSIAGFRGLPERSGYSASKFAMNGFLESLRTELLPHEVHVLTACPGFTASNIRKAALTGSGDQQGESQREEAKMMSAEEVADRIYRAVQNRKRTLVLTRQGKMTVFFNKWLGAWMDKMVYKHLQKEANSSLK